MIKLDTIQYFIGSDYGSMISGIQQIKENRFVILKVILLAFGVVRLAQV